MGDIPRAEHPFPQWERKNWVNLNGEWEFDFDFSRSARDRRLFESDQPLSRRITVPFCPESKLSGIEYTDFIPAVCYKRTFTLSEADLNGHVFLHFGAVDHDAYVYVNGKLAGTHSGGYTSFCFDITDFSQKGENVLFVIAEDDTRNGLQAIGKQSVFFSSRGCSYTRTTGIWQTVWLEMTPETYIRSAKYYTDIRTGSLTVLGIIEGKGKVNIQTSFEGRDTGSCSFESEGGAFTAHIKLSEIRLWDIGCGALYDLKLSCGEDTVTSYFGLREVRLDGMKFKLNGRTVFQRTVLDQGFYPDGIYTAPTENDLKADIERSLALGFNGARLHQKVFEPRFLYHCDRLGYMAWGEYGSWGFDPKNPVAADLFLNGWVEAVERDFNHPSIIGWCPLNETWDYIAHNADFFDHKTCDRLLENVYRLTKLTDITRPVIDTSGFYHVITDIYDVHDYAQDASVFRSHFENLPVDGTFYDRNAPGDRVGYPSKHYNGEPIFISEYGGIRWNVSSRDGWGYGEAPKTEEEFIKRFRELADALLDNPKIMGLCYTQLYDVEQELNGLYTYEREPKFDTSLFKAILSRKAAIED